MRKTKEQIVKDLKEAYACEDCFPGVLGNPVAFAARWGLPLSESYLRSREHRLRAASRRRDASGTKGNGALSAQPGWSGELKLLNQKGEHLGEIRQSPEYLFYRRHREAATYQVGYTIGIGEFALDGVVTKRGPTVRRPIMLSEEESLPIVREILGHLRSNGYPAWADVAA